MGARTPQTFLGSDGQLSSGPTGLALGTKCLAAGGAETGGAA